MFRCMIPQNRDMNLRGQLDRIRSHFYTKLLTQNINLIMTKGLVLRSIESATAQQCKYKLFCMYSEHHR